MSAATAGARAAAAFQLTPDLLAGRTVIVTGGSMGIGRAAAEAVLQGGARVVIVARGAEALEETRAQLSRTYGDRVDAIAADVSDERAVTALFETVADRFGGIDGVVHAAAIAGPIGRIDEIEPAEWWHALEIDLFGTFLVARAAAIAMRGRGGRIVLLSGGGATAPMPRFSAYACSKAAVVRLTETLAQELAEENIAVNALAPGFVATRIHDSTLAAGERAGIEYLHATEKQLSEGGVPVEHPGKAAAFLLSDAARGINGRLLSAVWDDWAAWPERGAPLDSGDLFTLRRIVPRDRALSWQ